MANEVAKVELTNNTGFPRRYTVASGVSIAKHTVLDLSDPRTAAASTSEGAPSAGFASMAKDGTDFSTSITSYTDGIFKATASGAIVIGAPLISAGHDNYLKQAPNDASGAAIVGYSLEAVGDLETFQMRLDI